jgi:hypothetical protein
MIVINNVAISTDNEELANSLLHKIYKAKIVNKIDFINYYLNLLNYYKIKYETHLINYMYNMDFTKKYNLTELKNEAS